MMANPSDQELHALITLMSLKHAGPRRLRALLTAVSAVGVVDALRARRRPTEVIDPARGPVTIGASVWEGWFNEVRAKADTVDLDAYRRDGRQILHPSDPAWPFQDDPDPPVLLFVSGSLELLEHRPSVAIVGTRRCTSVGRSVADSIGRELANADVVVVSGLALGVDAAAHRGAASVDGSLIGVVASGLDTVYPASNRELWQLVASDGLLVSEVPLGQRPTRWRFPARNRIIAGLSDLVVVVESHAKGGALSTVEEAGERGVDVVAVPGSTRSPASDGTNALLIDGAAPVRDGADVLAALGVVRGERPERPERHSATPAERSGVRTEQTSLDLDSGGETSTPERRLVLDAVAAGPVHIDRLIELLGRPAFAVGLLVDDMVSARLLSRDGHVVRPVEPNR